MDSIELTIAEGKEAERILGSPVVQKAFNSLRTNATSRILSSSPTDTEGREQAYFHLKAVEALEQQLRKIKTDGVVEQDKLDKQAKRTRGVRKS